jgi:dolichol-phosphate mannosyltransferase
MLLSIIVPTYNERQNIRPLVERIGGALEGIPYELIFVDDSTDGTDTVIAECEHRTPQVRLIHRGGQRGLATAVAEGIRRAKGEVVSVLDGDLQHPPEVLPLLLAALERTRADVAVASRNMRGGGYEAFTLTRQIASRGATLLARTLLSRARLVSDPMSGFFAVRKKAIAQVCLRPRGYKILLEILVRGHLGRVVEVPYRFQSRGAGCSKLTAWQQWEFLLHLVDLVTVQTDDLRLVRFCLVGASGALVNMAVLWALVAHFVYYLDAGIVAVVTAITWNFLWNDVFTWGDRRSSSLRAKALRYFQYWTVTGVTSAGQIILLFLLTAAGLPYLISNAVGIGVAAGGNFWCNGRWTWRASRPAIARIVYDDLRLDETGGIAPAEVSGD